MKVTLDLTIKAEMAEILRQPSGPKYKTFQWEENMPEILKEGAKKHIFFNKLLKVKLV